MPWSYRIEAARLSAQVLLRVHTCARSHVCKHYVFVDTPRWDGPMPMAAQPMTLTSLPGHTEHHLLSNQTEASWHGGNCKRSKQHQVVP